MKTVLQPGITAPNFALSAANLVAQVSIEQHRGKSMVIVFFPSSFEADLHDRLIEYENQGARFEEHDAVVIGISDAMVDDLRQLSNQKNIGFLLLSDSAPSCAIAARYGVVSTDQALLPTVFIVDQDGLIRRVYEASQYPDLPKPAMVVRAIKKLADAPKPVPITRDDWRLGSPDAPVAVIEYADYQCGPCGEAYRLLTQIVPAYRDKVLWVHRHLPLRHSHPLAQQAAEATEAAGAQGKFWEMHDRLFEARGALERDQLIEYAREIGLDVERFIEDLDGRCFRDAVNEDFKLAVANKIKLPPALFINSISFEGPRTREAICARIDSLLACTAE
jgi:peroxiredoxin